MVAMFGASIAGPLGHAGHGEVGIGRPAPPCATSRWSGCPSPRRPRLRRPPPVPATSRGMPDSIGSIGSGIPMRPVEHTSTSSAGTPSPSAVSRHMVAASARPRSPVAALALPLDTSTAAARPPLAAMWARLTCTGAAQARFRVKVAAVGTGRPSSVATRARSSAPGGLDAGGQSGGHEPGGGGDAHGYTPTTGRPAPSGSAEGQVGALHGLPGRPLDQVVDGRQHHHPPGAGVDPDRQVGGVRPAGRLGRRRGVGDDDEGLVVVPVVQEPHGVLRGQCAGVGGSGVAGGQDAPHHGGQVGREQDRGAEALLHLRRCGGGRAGRRPRSPRRPWRSGGCPSGARPAPEVPLAASTTRAGPPGPAAPGRRPRPAGRGPAGPPSDSTRERRSGWRRPARRGAARAVRRRRCRAARGPGAPRRTRSGTAPGRQPEVGGQVDDDAHPVDQIGHQVLGLRRGAGPGRPRRARRARRRRSVRRPGPGTRRPATACGRPPAAGAGSRRRPPPPRGRGGRRTGAAAPRRRTRRRRRSRPSWALPTCCKSMHIFA